MKLLNSLKFKYKLIILVMLPLVGFLVLSISNISDSAKAKSSLDLVLTHSELSEAANKLVHELQKERGMTAAFIGSDGKKMQSNLIEQRRTSDRFLNEYSNFQKQFKTDNHELSILLRDIGHQLGNLQSIRTRITQLSIESGPAIQFYTQLNRLLLRISALLVANSTSEVVKASNAFYNFIEAKERAGVERAVLSNTFAADQFSGNLLDSFLTLTTEQKTFLNIFLQFSEEEQKQYYMLKMQNPAINEVDRMRQIARNQAQNGGFGIRAESWFEHATTRINLLKEVENHITQTLINAIRTQDDDAYHSLIASVAFSFVLFFVALGCAFLIAKNVNTQVGSIQNAIGKVRNEFDLTARAEVIGQDELGQIAVSLNTTIERFSDCIGQMKTGSEELASSAEQTSSTISLSTSNLEQQQDETLQIATAIEQMSASVKEVSRNTASAMSATNSANSKSQNGQAAVIHSVEVIENLTHEVERIGEMISKLHASSNNIYNVMDVIKSVADQTNLLALNAAIEAARAGEHGRGFAVVADEVRSLASRTQDSTQEIEKIISELQEDANNAFEVIEESRGKAQQTIDSAKELEGILSEIVTSMNEINDMSQQVAAATEQQVSVTNAINTNVSQIEQRSLSAVSGSKEVAQTARNLENLAVQLNQAASRWVC
ncbi:methyl-accepting chemotaxis protein [Aliikangiella coralliicola]|uniref:Methyl-accepting chemotaxis protein n=1 Tax=Aliikangiella coralliicola TaxID=2592383 RepID=A0A545U766_9GAMM|nr:methyl-accepting chemotaxis protein [Aliikangiella coralliicola]TQV85302.1 methyl-accepting chemotaxis protein [Aliikangiella coralliicola]